ncbi:hypothetical protein B2J93_5813 [Marssonina coronariae]|uniref:Myb-like DNA-binding domain-containing protein n=1 Tax=Diplocarpon coronariae TaxID=2795749 RepID=A0A218YU21_9HELO|nr:hypothetical protein B2J93_5813 [Marssonina coronariae]
MSDTENAAGSSEDMPKKDIDFLISCIKNVTGGNLSVDVAAVAAANNMTNVRSAANRIGVLRKKYGFAIVSSNNKNAAATAADGESDEAADGPAIPKTPTPAKTAKGKVTKAKATPKKVAVKKTPAKTKKAAATPAKVKSDGEDEGMVDAKNSQPEEGEGSAEDA